MHGEVEGGFITTKTHDLNFDNDICLVFHYALNEGDMLRIFNYRGNCIEMKNCYDM